MVSHDQNPEYLDFANRVLGVNIPKEGAVWITSLINGQIAGVTVYNRITKWNCEMSTASANPRWLSKAYLQAAFRYPFVQCGMTSVYAVAEADNKKAIEFDIRVGFKPKCVLEDWFGNMGGILLFMKRSDCKWIAHDLDQAGNLRLAS